jgi:hypothetical protein
MVVARSRRAAALKARLSLRRAARRASAPATRRSPRVINTLAEAAKRRLARRMRDRSLPALPRRAPARPRPRPDLTNMTTMPPCGSRSSLGARGLVTRGTLSYTVIPGNERSTRQVLARQVVCASEITMNGRLKVLPMRNGSFVLEVVSVMPAQVRKGDVLLIQRGKPRTRGVISEMLGPLGNWDVRWNDSRLIITPVRN